MRPLAGPVGNHFFRVWGVSARPLARLLVIGAPELGRERLDDEQLVEVVLRLRERGVLVARDRFDDGPVHLARRDAEEHARHALHDEALQLVGVQDDDGVGDGECR